MHQVLSMKRSQTSVKNHMTQSMRMRQQGQNKGRMNVSFSPKSSTILHRKKTVKNACVEIQILQSLHFLYRTFCTCLQSLLQS